MTRTKKKEKVRNVERNKRSKKRKKFIKKHSDLSASEQKHLKILDESESEDEIRDVTYQAVLVKQKISLPQAIVIAKLRRDKRLMDLEIDDICDKMQDQLSHTNSDTGTTADQSCEAAAATEYPEIKALAQSINKLYIKHKKKSGRRKKT